MTQLDIATYINLISQLRLEGVGALRNPPIQIVTLVYGQVMGADGCHSEAPNSSHTCTKLNTLTIPLAHTGLLLPAHAIGGSAGHDTSISRQGF